MERTIGTDDQIFKIWMQQTLEEGFKKDTSRCQNVQLVREEGT